MLSFYRTWFWEATDSVWTKIYCSAFQLICTSISNFNNIPEAFYSLEVYLEGKLLRVKGLGIRWMWLLDVWGIWFKIMVWSYELRFYSLPIKSHFSLDDRMLIYSWWVRCKRRISAQCEILKWKSVHLHRDRGSNTFNFDVDWIFCLI